MMCIIVSELYHHDVGTFDCFAGFDYVKAQVPLRAGE